MSDSLVLYMQGVKVIAKCNYTIKAWPLEFFQKREHVQTSWTNKEGGGCSDEKKI